MLFVGNVCVATEDMYVSVYVGVRMCKQVCVTNTVFVYKGECMYV